MTHLTREHLDRLTLMRAVTPGVWCPNLLAFVDKYGPMRALQRIRDRTAPRAIADEIQTARPDINADIAAIESGGLRFVIPDDVGWPAQLAAPADDPADFTPPLGLWLYGEGDLSDVQASLAVVGAQNPLDEARDLTINVARHHAAAGTTIVAPGQWGVGLRAISAAVTADHRATPAAVLVAACGLATLAETQSGRIDAIVAAGGLVVSEYPLDTPVRVQHQFDQSARLAAALANATYVVDATALDPAMEGAATALTLGHPVYAFSTPHASYDTSGSDMLLEHHHAAPAARPEDISPADLTRPCAAALAGQEA